MTKYRLGLILVGLGFLAMFVGVGTSDMEVASGIIKPLTGVGLGIVGLMFLALGTSLLRPNS